MNPQDHGVRKAAILVANLTRETAEVLLKQMGREQAQLVRRKIAELGPVDPEERQGVINEFFRVGQMVPCRHSAGIELDERTTQRLSLGSNRLPPRETASSHHEDTTPFGFLHETEVTRLARILAAERPQTIALVLSQLPPEQAGSVLVRLSPIAQVEVIRRLVDLEETDAQTLREVERGLESRLRRQVQMQRRRVAGLSAVTEILQASGQHVGMEILDNLSMHDQRLAERLAPVRLEFDDLAHLNSASLTTVLQAVDPQVTILALVGVSPDLTERILQEVPDAHAEIIRRQLDHLGPTRLSDVEEARRQVAETTRRLAATGRIELPPTLYKTPANSAA